MFKLLETLVPMPLSENLTAKVCSLFSCTRKIHKRQSRKQSKSPRLDFRSLVRRRWKCLSPLKSGVKVFVHGREDVKMYDDKAGNKQIAINVEASEVFLCGMKGEGNQQAAPAQSNSTAAPTPTSSDNPADDLPF